MRVGSPKLERNWFDTNSSKSAVLCARLVSRLVTVRSQSRTNKASTASPIHASSRSCSISPTVANPGCPSPQICEICEICSYLLSADFAQNASTAAPPFSKLLAGEIRVGVREIVPGASVGPDSIRFRFRPMPRQERRFPVAWLGPVSIASA